MDYELTMNVTVMKRGKLEETRSKQVDNGTIRSDSCNVDGRSRK